MPYAFDNGISQDPPDGDVEYILITDEQFQEAIAAMMSGKRVSIVGGVLSFIDPETYEPEPENPLSKPMLRAKFRLAMLRNGYGSAAIAAGIASITDEMVREETQIEWEDSPQFYRYQAVVINLTMALGISEEDVDRIWTEGVNG